MKTTDFGFYTQKYFLNYLPNHCGSTPQTIDTYRYAFISFLRYMKEVNGVEADDISVSDLKRETVEKWYDWIEKTNGNSVSTRNQRQAAMNGFIHFLEYELPEYLNEYQRILSIHAKKAPQPVISYVKEDGMKAILNEINLDNPHGIRDLVILTIMYSAGIRVSEVIEIKVKDVSFSEPASILIHGKGQKSRYIPIFTDVKPYLERYMSIMNYARPGKEYEFLFKNHMKQKLTRQGVTYIVKKYSQKARDHNPDVDIPSEFSCHKIRYSTAMGMVDEGIDLIYIRDLLGHASVKTTEIYAKANAKKKRDVIEAAASHITPIEEPEWESNVTLKEWLKTFNKVR